MSLSLGSTINFSTDINRSIDWDYSVFRNTVNATYWTWFYYRGTDGHTNGKIWHIGNDVLSQNTGGVFLERQTSGTAQSHSSSGTPFLVANNWYFICASYPPIGTIPSLFVGELQKIATSRAASSSNVGTGTLSDNGSSNLTMGNFTVPKIRTPQGDIAAGEHVQRNADFGRSPTATV